MQSRATTYTVSTATVLSDSGDMLHVGLDQLGWLNAVVATAIFLIPGIYLITLGGSSMLLGLFAVSVGVGMAFIYPVKASLVFDFRACLVRFSSRYLLHFPMKVEAQWNLSQVVEATAQMRSRQRRVSVLMSDGNRFKVDFKKELDAERFLYRMERLAQRAAFPEPEAAPALDPAQFPIVSRDEQVVAQAKIQESRSLIQRELRSWSVWLFIIAAFQMFAAKGFSPWGLLLILVGLAALYFREAQMFIIFAATIAFAAIDNAFSGKGQWLVFAALQVYFSVQLVLQFRRFLKMEKLAGEEAASGRARRLFPWLSLILGGGGLMGIILFWVAIILLIILVGEPSKSLTLAIGLLEVGMAYAGILGIGAGAASLASHFPRKAASIIGVVCGGLVVIMHVILVAQ